jgi:hypothetical protein
MSGGVFGIKAPHTLVLVRIPPLSFLVAFPYIPLARLSILYHLPMAPCTRQARKARNPSHTSMGLNNTVFGDPTHASAVDHVGDEGQPLANTTQSQTNAIGKSNTTISDLDHMLITPRKTHLFHLWW